MHSRSGSSDSHPSTPATAHSSEPAQSFDDVWGDDHYPEHGLADNENFSHHQGIVSDVNRLKVTHTTVGYREGLAAARAAAAQIGFDEGYLLASAIGIRAGWLIGLMENIVKAIGHSAVSNDTAAQVGAQAAQMTKELGIEQLLSESWITKEGTWNWSIDAHDKTEVSEPTIQAVASAHPVIKKWTEVVYAYCQSLHIIRQDEQERV